MSINSTMTTQERVQKALDYHRKGFSCSQAVAMSFVDKVDIDKSVLFSASEGFGLGGGNTQGICGALSGAIIINGLKNSCADINNPHTKSTTQSLSRQILDAFSQKNGTIICGLLKGKGTQKVVPCSVCIEDSVRIAAKVIFDED
jgi:C_GCAxxG_C_C family probable redox protein